MKKRFFILLFFVSGIQYAQDVLDKIVAVVDNEIIMLSELNFNIQMFASQRKLNPGDPNIKLQVLNTLIEEKLIYAQAELDSVIVSQDEVDQRLEMQMDYFIRQYGSREKVEEIYGMSIEKIKRELSDEMRKNIMMQRLQDKKFGTIEATRREVEQFFGENEDSLGLIPEKLTLSHIFINPRTSSKVKQKFYEFARTIRDSIINGGEFAVFAKKYSEDPGSASNGGDLGSVKRGIFFPEFESAAFALRPGEISEVVESPVGFHIIELLDRKGESIHTRHILIKIKNSEEDDLRAIEFLSDLRDSILQGKNTFSFYARLYSDDKETAKLGGSIGTSDITQLDKSMLDAIANLKEGEISYPRRLQLDQNTYGYHIVKLEKRLAEHKPDLQTDYIEIKQIADYAKKQRLYREWIEEIKENIYWEIRL